MAERPVAWLRAAVVLLPLAGGCVDVSVLGGGGDAAESAPPDLAVVEMVSQPSPDLGSGDLAPTSDLIGTFDLTMNGPVVLNGNFVGGGPAAQAGNYELRVQLLFSGGAVLQSGNYTLEGWLR